MADRADKPWLVWSVVPAELRSFYYPHVLRWHLEHRGSDGKAVRRHTLFNVGHEYPPGHPQLLRFLPRLLKNHLLYLQEQHGRAQR